MIKGSKDKSSLLRDADCLQQIGPGNQGLGFFCTQEQCVLQASSCC